MNITYKLCSVCYGCGHTSRGQLGEILPQPTYTGSDSTGTGWTRCIKCDGVGVVVDLRYEQASQP